MKEGFRSETKDYWKHTAPIVVFTCATAFVISAFVVGEGHLLEMSWGGVFFTMVGLALLHPRPADPNEADIDRKWEAKDQGIQHMETDAKIHQLHRNTDSNETP